MEELRSAADAHMNLMADLVQKVSAELRTGLRPAYDNFIGFFFAIDWKEPWLMVAGVYFAENLNRVLGSNWKHFATQNYFDPRGIFLSALWSGPLLLIATIILMSTLISLCSMMVRWKRAELRHRARISRNKDD